MNGTNPEMGNISVAKMKVLKKNCYDKFYFKRNNGGRLFA
jgi:hypothetical protein